MTIKTLFSSANYAAGKSQQPRWPSEIFLEISNICDLKCAMCPTFSPLNPNRFRNLQSESRGLMQLDAFDANLQAVLANAHVVHAFGYGEPTIHPNFRLLLEQLGSYGVWVDFFTHGMHLSAELCEFLVEQKIGQITVSFSGASQEEYENIYVGGDFERVLDGIRRLDAAKKASGSASPEIHVNSIGFKHHVDKLPEFVRLMGGAGVNTINLKPLATYDPIPELHRHGSLMASAEDRERLREAEEIARSLGVSLKITFPGTVDPAASETEELGKRHKGKQFNEEFIPLMEVGERARNAGKSKDYKRGPKREGPKSRPRKLFSREDATIDLHDGMLPCIEPLSTMYIDLNGNVRPCCFANTRILHLGHIREQSGVEIWNSEAFRAVRDLAAERKYPRDLCEMCIKGSSYPKVVAGKWLNRYLAVFADRRVNFLPWRFLVPLGAHIYARKLRPPYRARFFSKVNKVLLWIGMERRQRGQIPLTPRSSGGA